MGNKVGLAHTLGSLQSLALGERSKRVRHFHEIRFDSGEPTSLTPILDWKIRAKIGNLGGMLL